MRERNNKPLLRFKGFSNAWEQRELLDVAQYRNGKAHENSISDTGKYVVVNSKFVSTDGEIRKFTHDLIEPLSAGEIAFVLSDVPNGRAIARTFLVDENDKYSLNQRIAGLKPNVNTDSYFLSILMNRNRYFLAYDDGAKQTNLAKADVEKFNALYPNAKEQTKIGELFRSLDNLITLHQHKYEKLQNIKKELLSKLFPEEGSVIPRLRFKNFNQNWEQRGFNEITFLSGVKNKDNMSFVSFSITHNRGFVPQDEQFEMGGTMRDADKSMYYIVSPRTFAYNPARINVGSIGYYSGTEDVIVSSLYEVFKTTEVIDNRFLWHWFKSDNLNRLVEKFQEGGVRLYFYYDKLCKGFIITPKKEEQEKIGRLLDNINNLITLYQRKCEKLQSIKKALLNKMFV